MEVDTRREAALNESWFCSKRAREEDARTRLVEAIARPISSESRGFKLLSMMGYKPGMSIGVSRDGGTDGIKEPISIDLISGRHGIGHGKRSHASTTSTGAAVRPDTTELASEFQGRKRNMQRRRQIIGDLTRLRKACQELDCRQGKKLPTQSWHWPIYQVQIASDGTVSRLEAEDDTDFNENRRLKQGRHQPSPNLLDVQGPVTVRLVYANGCEVTTLEKDFNEMTEEGLSACLGELSEYVRSTYRYCHWCGTEYGSTEELATSCPGVLKDDHE